MPLRKSAADRKPASSPADPASAGRLGQLKAVYSITRQRDPKLPFWLAGSALIPIAIGVVLGLLIGPIWLWVPIFVLLGFVIAANVFSRRVQRTAFAELEGKPGAAAGVIERMRGDWRVTPAVQVNRQQDVVHRVVGRPGIVIIAEGRGRGPRDLLANEVRRVRRVAGDYPVRDIVVGNGEGEVPLDKLQMTLMKLPRVIKGGEIDALERRLRAVGAANLPIPKGPVPTRVPRGKMR